MIRVEEEKIAVLLASCQGKAFLPEMLDSLLAQTCQEFVCVIHDDGSRDGTVSIIEDYVRRYPQKFVQLHGKCQGSAKGNFLWMLSQVEAACYMFADQDDVWLPEKIAKSRKAYRQAEKETEAKTPGMTCIFTDLYVTDEKLKPLAPSMIRYIGRNIADTAPGQILMDNPAAGCTMFFGRSLRDAVLEALEAKGWQNALPDIFMHDQFILAAASLLGTAAGLDEPLVYYRQHGNNEMGAKQESRREKLQRNIRDVIRGDFRKEKKEFLQVSRNMAGVLQKLPGLSDGQRQCLQEFAEIGKKSKLRRIAFYRRHGIMRTSRCQTWWMYLWV